MTEVYVGAIAVAVAGWILAELRAWIERRRFAEEREFWRLSAEKLMNRIADPITETARSQIEQDSREAAYQGEHQEPSFEEKRLQQVAEIDEVAARRGIDLSGR